MPGPVLLVLDDIALISVVRRHLSREGREVVLASSVADAIIAFGHYRPDVVLLSPKVEDGRGPLVVDELRQHPEGHPLHLLLLGEGIEGVDAPLVLLPLEAAALIAGIEAARAREPIGGWAVREPMVPVRAPEAEQGQARGPRGSMAARLFGDLRGAPNDAGTSAPGEDEGTQVGPPPGAQEVTQVGARSPFFVPEHPEETTQQTVIPEWLRTVEPEGVELVDAQEVARLRAELARAQEVQVQTRAMLSALRLQTREAEAALRRQADSRHDASPVEQDPAALTALQGELQRAQEDARGARRSLGRAISRQKELEAELDGVRAGGGGTAGADGDVVALREKVAQLEQSQAGAEAQQRELEALRSELEVLREGQVAQDGEREASLARELEALRSTRATQEALAEETQRELGESLEASEAQRAALAVELDAQGARAGEERARLHEALASGEAERARLAEQLGALEAQLASARAVGAQDDVEAQAQLREALASSEKSRTRLQASLEAAERAREDLRAQLLAETAAHAALTGALDSEREQLTSLRVVQGEAQRELRGALELSEASRAALEVQVADARARANEQHAAQAQAAASLAEAEARLAVLDAEVSTLRAASDRASEAEASASELSMALAGSEARTRELEAARHTLEAQGAEVHRRLAEALAEANARVLALEAQLDELRGTADVSASESATAHAELEALRTELARTQASQMSHAVALEQLRRQHADLVLAYDATCASLGAQAAAEATAREAAQEALEALRQDAGGETERLSALLEQARVESRALAQSHEAELESQALAQDAALQTLRAALEIAEGAHRAQSEELAALEAQRAASLEGASEAKATIERLEAEARALEATALAEHELLSGQLAALQAEHLALQEERSSAVAAMQAERIGMREALATGVAAAQAKQLEAEAELASAVAAMQAERISMREALATGVAAAQAKQLEAEAELASAVAAMQAERISMREALATGVAAAQAEGLEAKEALAAALAEMQAERLTLQGELEAGIAAAHAKRLEAEAGLAATVAALQAQRVALQDDLAAGVAAAHAKRLEAEEALAAEVAASHARRLALEDELSEARRALETSDAETGRLRAEQESILARAVGAVGVVVGDTAEGAGGPLDRSRLISLVTELHLSRPEARLEVRSSDAMRVLFFRDGALVGATSTAPGETLLDRARRDGLIDARQEAELRLLRGVSSSDLLRALRERGYLRENEVLPLVQRHTEQLVLEVFSQSDALFRLSLERTPPGLVLAAAVRPPLVLLTEALRTAAPVEGLLASLGGLGASVRPLSGALGLGDLGLREPELALLRRAQVPTTLEQLLLGSGMRQEVALRTLALGRAFGLLSLEPGEVDEEVSEAADDLEVRRLASKFDEVQDADYFTVLGLPRSASGAEIRRAFELLSTEFHPLRFAGHPDPLMQRRAQVVQELLSEALQALEDDRLREAYAHNLRD